MSKEWMADYYDSIHHNAGINGGIGGGTVVFVYPGTSEKTMMVQDAIYRRAIARGGLKGNRAEGTITADFYVLRKTRMSAGLVECGFMDSATDIHYILKPEWSGKIALGIAEGICEVFGGTIHEEKMETGKALSAESFDYDFAGKYMSTTVDLKLREGANTKYDVIDSVPLNGEVQCYGYYTKEMDGTIWLYVVYNGQIGFISKRYLVK